MNQEQKEKVNIIADRYGLMAQADIACEECSELIKALLKDRRGKATLEDVVDELADVEIMIEQLKHLYGCEEMVDERIDFKIIRQLHRMKRGK